MSIMDQTEYYLREGLPLGQSIALAVQDAMRRDLDVYEGVYAGADD